MVFYYVYKGGIKISILQEYEEIKKEMGCGRFDAIGDYLNIVNKNKSKELFLSDVLYKQNEYEKFDKWFNDEIKPFELMEYSDGKVAVFLSQENYAYNWLEEIKVTPSLYGDGHCYEDVFRDYLESNFSQLNKYLDYDSENGMFCVYCKDKRDAEKVIYELSSLYKDEEKMIELIKNTKEKYQYEFDIKI